MHRKIKSSKNNQLPGSCAMNQLFQISRKHSRGDDSGGMERQAASWREKNRTAPLKLICSRPLFGSGLLLAGRREERLACLHVWRG